MNRSTSQNYEKSEDKVLDELDASSVDSYDHTQRKLKNRHIQLMAIGGTIGTALFVQIGSALTQGGPASLFIAFTLWSTFILAINNCLSEMVTWIPISSPFVRFADHFVDPALGFCAGINFFVFETMLIPFEVTAFNLVLQFWTDKIPLVAAICFVLVCYLALNLWTVRYFGESEFWFASGKVILAVGLIFFTFVTMVGGNPIHDAYGFRFWNRSFVGFLACFIQASFTIAGPDMVSIAAGEVQNPRKILPRAFNSVFYRLTTFFVMGSLCVPHRYVIAMQRLKIPVLPHIVNALVLTSIFSAGNSYGKAPAIFKRCSRNGVPVYCVIVTLAMSLLSFLQVSNNSAVVLEWFVNLVTASQLLNYAIICFTYMRFYKASRLHSLDSPNANRCSSRNRYYGFTGTIIMAFVGGYTVFLPGKWDIPSFFFSYTMIGILPVLFVFWKFYRGTQVRVFLRE
ncbi:hypothetical protein BT96DRAFT_962194 [Gymnopus androsaceus JB14]|uniref:Amino acid permease/ SLC12A domain-containing protein n=1 Tax=Gymnopus androsaceus JB14 TaxID=1447944 RepID=A0A6A4IFY4_9AGAR|nr:hypothetical protein BT96DRAFT_962194 [Gymnopus androsaceus JB14]